MLYAVQLTTVAEEAYVALYEEAQIYLDAGEDEHSAILTFDEVQHAMMETLPISPCDSGWPMAGNLSWLHVLNLNSVTIIYIVADAEPSKPKVIVQTISKRVKDASMRLWLSSRIESGEMAPVLESLGVQPYLMRMEVNSRMVH